ncbi:hypothetical protein Tco_1251234, partial [Tanacetum coccineum]
RKEIHVPKLALTAEYFREMGVEGNRFRPTMLEGTLKTIEDTMARMDKEAYDVYNEAGLMGFCKGIIPRKLQRRLRGEEDLQGMCFCSEFKGKQGLKLELHCTTVA